MGACEASQLAKADGIRSGDSPLAEAERAELVEFSPAIQVEKTDYKNQSWRIAGSVHLSRLRALMKRLICSRVCLSLYCSWHS
jgi:hypothetical protein